MAKKPYDERTDAEKVRSNWNKTLGLFDRGEYSVCVLRAAITCELAINLALYVELSVRHNLNRDFVSELLRDANGINNKFNKLLLKILKGQASEQAIKPLRKPMEDVNKERNSVAHSGQFKSRAIADKTLTNAHRLISSIAAVYCPDIELRLPPQEQGNERPR